MELKLDFDTKKLNTGFADIQKANTIAVRSTLNVMAGLTRKNALGNVRSDFINRNEFTEKSIVFRSARGMDISNMSSSAGALERAGYMELQEEGGTRKTKNGTPLAIATNTARGGSRSSSVRRSNYLKAMRKNAVSGQSRKHYKSVRAKNVARAYVAFKEKKFLSRSGGIYTVGSFRKSKRGINFKSRMIYNTKHQDVQVSKTPWLEPATFKPVQDAQSIYNSQVNKLLRKAVI